MDELLRLVTAAVRNTQRDEIQMIDAFKLTLTQYKIMTIVDSTQRSLSPSELSDRLGLSPAATSRAVDGLVRAGLVGRVEDPEDRRVKRLSLTEKGAEAVRPLWSARRTGLAGMVAGLTERQRADLVDALHPLLAVTPALTDASAGAADR
ncbi:MarR family transcriptional regulator [Streptomyces sp. NPDC058457]|uniref:MarR family transcriptional regulator n=1 Tax=Streptomyces sp. NPDC058457 TaxID=3346507 RepID=UPI00364C3CD7